jgi:hypothetical protein
MDKNNKLEELNLRLDKLKEELADNRANVFEGEITNAIILAGEIGIYAVLSELVPTAALVTIMAMFYVRFKAMNVFTNGTRMSRYSNGKSIKANIKGVEEDIAKIKELDIYKEKNRYIDNTPEYDEFTEYISRPRRMKVRRLTKHNFDR